MSLLVKSVSETGSKYTYKVFLKNFKIIIDFFYTAENNTQYNLILENESGDILQQLDNHLKSEKKLPEFDRNNIVIHYNTEEQKKACSQYNFNSTPLKETTVNIFQENYKPQDGKPSYVYKDNKVSYYSYFDNKNIKIIRLEGFGHNPGIIPYFHNNTYIFVMIPCYTEKAFFCKSRNVLFSLNPGLNPNNIIWECPNINTYLFAKEYDFDAIFCNHNCWLDYNIFGIKTITTKSYDLVINSRPEKWKRVHLAKKVANVAYIKGFIFRPHDVYDLNELGIEPINKKYLSPHEVNDIYNKSVCGGIFSEKEGACYSSSEYLLCGIPVISTESCGGRDTWYNSKNAIIISPDEKSVQDAVEICKLNTELGIFNSEMIRKTHIYKSEIMRANFNKKKYK
jgi:glycosyltransferase involved in cell wall biosynthesis